MRNIERQSIDLLIPLILCPYRYSINQSSRSRYRETKQTNRAPNKKFKIAEDVFSEVVTDTAPFWLHSENLTTPSFITSLNSLSQFTKNWLDFIRGDSQTYKQDPSEFMPYIKNCNWTRHPHFIFRHLHDIIRVIRRTSGQYNLSTVQSYKHNQTIAMTYSTLSRIILLSALNGVVSAMQLLSQKFEGPPRCVQIYTTNAIP